MTRLSTALALVFLAAVAPVASQDGAGPSAPYLELLRRYAAGDRAAAVGGLTDWSERKLQGELKGLRGTRPYTEQERARLQVAIMLHTDRDAWERTQAPVVETSRECGATLQSAFAESLVGLLLVKGQASDFARRWYLAMALRSHSDLCLEDTLRWARSGMKWFPKDAELLLAQGTAAEVIDLFWTAPVAREWTGSRQLEQKAADAVERHATLELAQRSFEEALTAAPDLHEAKLRLGRVRWRLGRGEEGRAALEALVAQSADAPLRYLGHLFLGRIHEDAGRLEEAEVQYRAATLADPGSQVAAVALSHLLQLAGNARASREVLADAIARAPRRRSDPYWFYRLGRAYLAEGLFEELRRETLQ